MKTTKDNVTVNQSSVARHDEGLEDAANNYAKDDCEDVKIPFTIGYNECIHLDKEAFKEGANWQKQRDSIIIKSLVEALAECTKQLNVFADTDVTNKQPMNDAIKTAKQLLTKIKIQNNV